MAHITGSKSIKTNESGQLGQNQSTGDLRHYRHNLEYLEGSKSNVPKNAFTSTMAWLLKTRIMDE